MDSLIPDQAIQDWYQKLSQNGIAANPVRLERPRHCPGCGKMIVDRLDSRTGSRQVLDFDPDYCEAGSHRCNIPESGYSLRSLVEALREAVQSDPSIDPNERNDAVQPAQKQTERPEKAPRPSGPPMPATRPPEPHEPHFTGLDMGDG